LILPKSVLSNLKMFTTNLKTRYFVGMGKMRKGCAIYRRRQNCWFIIILHFTHALIYHNRKSLQMQVMTHVQNIGWWIIGRSMFEIRSMFGSRSGQYEFKSFYGYIHFIHFSNWCHNVNYKYCHIYTKESEVQI
jgi:hypothetical protein